MTRKPPVAEIELEKVAAPVTASVLFRLVGPAVEKVPDTLAFPEPSSRIFRKAAKALPYVVWFDNDPTAPEDRAPKNDRVPPAAIPFAADDDEL